MIPGRERRRIFQAIRLFIRSNLAPMCFIDGLITSSSFLEYPVKLTKESGELSVGGIVRRVDKKKICGVGRALKDLRIAVRRR